MLDLILTIALAIPTVVMAYLGGHMAVSPPQTPPAKRRYKLSFGILSLLSLVLITTIGIRQYRAAMTADAAQANLRGELKQTKEVAEQSQKQLGGIQHENSRLQASLEKAQQTTIGGFKNLLEEENRKHAENLDRFSTLLNDQQSLARKTEVGINRLLIPLPSNILVSFQIEIPGNQDSASHFIKRLKARQTRPIYVIEPDGPSFPDPSIHEEADLYGFLSFVRLMALFARRVDLKEFSTTPKERGMFQPIPLEPDLRIIADAPVLSEKPIGFGTGVGNRYQVSIRYEPTRDVILFMVWSIRVDVRSTKIQSLLDLDGYDVGLFLDSVPDSVAFNVIYFRLDPAIGRTLVSTKFARYYWRKSPIFIAKVSSD